MKIPSVINQSAFLALAQGEVSRNNICAAFWWHSTDEGAFWSHAANSAAILTEEQRQHIIDLARTYYAAWQIIQPDQ